MLYPQKLAEHMRLSKKAKLADTLVQQQQQAEEEPDVIKIGAVDRELVMKIAYGGSSSQVTAKAMQHEVSRQTVRRSIATGALALLLAQQTELENYEAEIKELVRAGGSLVRAVELVRWDETLQTLRLGSDLLEGGKVLRLGSDLFERGKVSIDCQRREDC